MTRAIVTEQRPGTFEINGRVAQGYAVVYDAWTYIGGLYRERIARGAVEFEDEVVALLDHDWGRVIGRQSAGTLRFSDRRDGLWVEIDLDSRTPDGMTALGTIDRQDLKGMSFGFYPLESDWDNLDDGMPERTITRLSLFEVSAVSFPAYPQTSITIKPPPISFENMSKEKRVAMKRMLLDWKERGVTL